MQLLLYPIVNSHTYNLIFFFFLFCVHVFSNKMDLDDNKSRFAIN